MINFTSEDLRVIEEHGYVPVFLNQWLGWVDQGTPQGVWSFSREHGLCRSYALWSAARGRYVGDAELTSLFWGNPHPFNATFQDYFDESAAQAMHLNARRVEWARLVVARCYAPGSV